MKISLKNRAIRCADYVLSQDCEREAIEDDAREMVKERDMNRREIRECLKDSTWFYALTIRDGYREANKELTELLNEVYDND